MLYEVVCTSSGHVGVSFDVHEAVLQSVAWAVDRNHVAVMEKTVEDGGGQDLVGEDLAPFAEALVRGQVCRGKASQSCQEMSRPR